MKSLQERFDEKWIPEPNSGCWLWTGAVSNNKYGVMGGGKTNPPTKRAHRLAYEIYRGTIPNNIKVLHKCDVKLCVNPDHLFLGTIRDNVLDMWDKGRNAAMPDSRTAQRRLMELGLYAKGEDIPHSKLNNNLVYEIKNKLSKGLSMQGLAKEYKVSYTTINRIKYNKSWKHVIC